MVSCAWMLTVGHLSASLSTRFRGLTAQFGPTLLSMMALLASMIKDLSLSAFGSRKAVMFIAKPSPNDLTLIGDLIATGKLEPVIDRRYTLNEASEAVRHVEEGHARGKVIITLERAHES